MTQLISIVFSSFSLLKKLKPKIGKFGNNLRINQKSIIHFGNSDYLFFQSSRLAPGSILNRSLNMIRHMNFLILLGASFEITAQFPRDLSLICPTDLVRPSCQSRGSDSIALQNWVNTSRFSGSCDLGFELINGSISFNGFDGRPPSNCGGTKTLNLTYTIICDNPLTCSATFTIPTPTPPVLTCPTNQIQITGQTQAQINSAFNTWLVTANGTGGCNGVLTNNNAGAPPATGGTTPVTFTYQGSPPSTEWFGACPFSTQTCQATFTVAPCLSIPDATISYTGSSFCTSAPDVTVNRTGTAGGTYSVDPSGLNIDASTGTIIPMMSTPGDYTVSYDIAAAPPCPAAKATTIVTIKATPKAPLVTSPQSFCILKPQVIKNCIDCITQPTLSGLPPLNVPTLADITISSGSGLNWYDENNSTMTLPTNTALINDSTYYVSQTVDGCESPRTPVMVTLNADCFNGEKGTKEGFNGIDPCTCNNDATTAQNDGTFDEYIVATGPSGATITFTQSAIGTGVPAALTWIESPPGTYTSSIFQHTDNVGYSVLLFAQVGNGSPVRFDSIGNKCAYPNVTITQIGPFSNAAGQPNTPLPATITSATTPASGIFTWSGTGVTNTTSNPASFNPSGLTVGPKDITLSYDAAFESNVSPDNGVTAALPGCIQPATSVVRINGSTLVCNGQVNVSADATVGTCQVTLLLADFGTPGPVLHVRNAAGQFLQTTGSFSSTRTNLAGATISNLQNLLRDKLNPTRSFTYEVAAGTAATDNRCWGNVIFEDKTNPTPGITCPADATIQCWQVKEFLAQTASTATAAPTWTDNCGTVTVTMNTINSISDCAGTITRTFIASDASGNTAPCVQNVTVRRDIRFGVAQNFPYQGPFDIAILLGGVPPNPLQLPGFDGVICPPDIKLTCEQWRGSVASSINAMAVGNTFTSTGYPGNVNTPVTTVTITANTVFPTKANMATAFSAPFFFQRTLAGRDTLMAVSEVCNLFTTFSPLMINACPTCPTVDALGLPIAPKSFKIINTWTILDWCSGNLYTCFPQVIKVTDETAPSVTIASITASTNPWTCTANVSVAVPAPTDGCNAASAVVVVRNASTGAVVYTGGAGSFSLTNQPCGVTTYNYTATDCCGNESGVSSFTVTIADKTPPFASAKRDIVVSLTYDGTNAGNASAKLLATQVDNGSFDNCGLPVRLEIRRTKSYSSSTSPVCFNNTSATGWQNNFTFSNFCTSTTERTYRVGTCDGHPVFAVYNCAGVLLRSYFEEPGRAIPTDRSCVFSLTTISSSWTLVSTTNSGDPLYSACDTDEGKFVKFCCTDLDRIEVDANGDGKVDSLDKGWIEVQLRVWDDADKSGGYSCAVDNYNDTWAYVKVECKLPPIITPPADATITCDWPLTKSVGVWTKITSVSQFEKVGVPTGYGVCGTLGLTDFEWRDTEKINKCGDGTVNREFRATYWGFTIIVKQKITINRLERSWEFYNDWPGRPCHAYYHLRPPLPTQGPFGQVGKKDDRLVNLAKQIEEAGCGGPTNAQILACQPLYTQGPCDAIGLSTDVETFQFENGECRKWVVDYHYYNWCNNFDVTYRKIWTYNDKASPVLVAKDTCIAVGVGTTPLPGSGVNQGLANYYCTTLPTVSKSATDLGCEESVTWIKWQVFVDLENNGTTDYIYSSFINPPVPGGSGTLYQDWTQSVVVNGVGIPAKYLAPTGSGQRERAFDQAIQITLLSLPFRISYVKLFLERVAFKGQADILPGFAVCQKVCGAGLKVSDFRSGDIITAGYDFSCRRFSDTPLLVNPESHGNHPSRRVLISIRRIDRDNFIRTAGYAAVSRPRNAAHRKDEGRNSKH